MIRSMAEEPGDIAKCFSSDNMRPIRSRSTVRNVSSSGYKGDDEDDDDGMMSVRRDDEDDNGPPTGVTVNDANVEAFAAAYMSKEDLVFIQTMSKGMRRKQKPIQKPETASRGRIDCGARGSSQTTANTASVRNVRNTGATHHSRNAKDPNPTYNQDALNPSTQNSNPMYPQSTPTSRSGVHPDAAFDSNKHTLHPQNPKQTHPINAQMQQLNTHTEPALDNSSIQRDAAANQEDDEATSGPASGDGDPTCQPYAVRYREEEEEDDAVGITPYAVAYMGQDDSDTTGQTDTNTNTPSSSASDTDISVFDDNALDPNPMYGENALNPNPTYPQNALNPNPMYVPNTLNPNPVPNAQQETSCVCTSRWVCVAVSAAIVLVLLIIGGACTGIYLNNSKDASHKACVFYTFFVVADSLMISND